MWEGITEVRATSNGQVEIQIFDKDKIKRLKEKYPKVKFIHIGIIKISITPLFKLGINSHVLCIIQDKRFHNPIQSLIGGIQSNLISGEIMFRVKPIYFVSMQDKGIQNIIVLRIQTHNIKIGGIHNDLRISWKAVHHLTNDTNVRTKTIDSSIIKLYEPKPFDTEIQLRFINWKDLSLPRE